MAIFHVCLYSVLSLCGYLFICTVFLVFIRQDRFFRLQFLTLFYMVKILSQIIFFSASNYLFKENVLPTNQVPFIGDYTRIVCAISNKFFPPLSPGTYIFVVVNLS